MYSLTLIGNVQAGQCLGGWLPIPERFDKEIRRKALAFAADAVCGRVMPLIASLRRWLGAGGRE